MAQSGAPLIDLSQDDDDGDEQQDELEVLGTFRTKVVGVRYYTGHANKDEMVLLVREPQNPYDRWAIRVDNVRGDKIGHIAREEAAALSPLIDQGKLRIEGIVQGAKGAYTMPIDIFCYGEEAHRAIISSRLRASGIVINATNAAAAAGQGQPEPGTRALTQSELDRSLETLWADIHAAAPLRPAMDPDDEVLSQLFPHQRVALAWMVERENRAALPPFWVPCLGRGGAPLSYLNELVNFTSDTRPAPLRGGILADDMGLGKTLIVISLVATNRPGVALPPVTHIDLGAGPTPDGKGKGKGKDASAARPAKRRKANASDDDDDDDDDGAGAGPSTSAGAGAAKKQKAAATAVPKPAPATNKKLSKAQQQADAEEPAPMPPRVGGPRATLIVCPVSVVSNWSSQIDEHTAGNLKVYVYHGPSRNRDRAFLASHDVVISTYSMLGSDLHDKARGLLSVPWLRVVLDEAHTIKNATAQMSKAAQALAAERRWAVTGTPIQNRLADLYGQLAFLKLEPLAERSIFSRAIDKPLKACDPRAVKKLQVLMGSIAMRRTKDMQVGGRPLVSLPRKTVNVVSITLTPDDRRKYDSLEHEGRAIISRHLRDATLLTNYASVLEIILRLRQVCDAGVLCPRDPLPLTAGLQQKEPGTQLTPEEQAKLLAMLMAGMQDECPICLSAFTHACITRCGHAFCRGCIEAVVVKQKPDCPMCRQHIVLADLLDVPEGEPDAATQSGTGVADPVGASAKVAALIKQLRAEAKRSVQLQAEGEAPVKSVVFSQFTGMLNLVQAALQVAGMSFVRLDGSTPAKARGDMLKAFARHDAASPTVFLVSLKAGGVGLNLTAASNIFLLDPWWNPSVEDQAADRVHRLGQTRDVEVYRFIAADTIEERMMALQESKRDLSRAAFDKRSADTGQMRINDIKLLMEL